MANWNVTTKFYLKVPYLLKELSYYHELESTMSSCGNILVKEHILEKPSYGKKIPPSEL